jgi:hypothetical protein
MQKPGDSIGENQAESLPTLFEKAVMRLLVDVGQVCADYQDHVLRNLSTRRLQLDELWSWIFYKNKNVTPKIAAKHPEAGVTDRPFDVGIL